MKRIVIHFTLLTLALTSFAQLPPQQSWIGGCYDTNSGYGFQVDAYGVDFGTDSYYYAILPYPAYPTPPSFASFRNWKWNPYSPPPPPPTNHIDTNGVYIEIAPQLQFTPGQDIRGTIIPPTTVATVTVHNLAAGSTGYVYVSTNLVDWVLFEEFPQYTEPEVVNVVMPDNPQNCFIRVLGTPLHPANNDLFKIHQHCRPVMIWAAFNIGLSFWRAFRV